MAAVPPGEDAEMVDDSDDEGAGDSFDYAGLVEAQKAAGSTQGAEELDGGARGQKRKKQRGGCKESQKRRKRQRREDDLVRAKQAGVPSLREALKAAAAAGAASATLAGPLAAAPGVGGSSSSSGKPAQAAAGGAAAPLLPMAAAAPAQPSGAAGSAGASAPSAAASSGAAASSSSAPKRSVAAYDDAEGPSDEARTAAAVARVMKEVGRRTKVAEAVNKRTVFITNLSFKATEQDVRDWLGKAGNIKEVRLRRDKSTARPLGYGHVQFEADSVAAYAVQKCDKVELHGRVMRVAHASQGQKIQFELPEEIKEDVRALMREKYEGMNLSTIKDAWQKRHPGQKLDTAKYGFKNFSTAVKTIEGVCLEIHLEKSLTNLAFFRDSPAHVAFLERRRSHEEEQRRKKEDGGVRKSCWGCVIC